MNRIGNTLVFLGVVILLFSGVGGFHHETMRMLSDDDPFMFFFETAQNISINVTLDDHSVGMFDVYLMHWEDANETLEQKRFADPIDPISSYINVSSVQEIITIPTPDIYVLLFISEATDLQIIWVELTSVGPNLGVCVGGIGIIGFGGIAFLIPILRKRLIK